MVDSDARDTTRGGNATEQGVKFPLRRVKLAIHRITEVAIPHHLDILSKQRTIIEKYQKSKQWGKVHDEQIKASLTVKQLKAALYELETLRSQVNPSDLKQFESLVQPASEATVQQVRSFTELCLPVGPGAEFFPQAQAISHEVESAQEAEDLSLGPQPFLIEHIPDNTAAYKSWYSLKKDQRERVESIEEHVTQAEEHVSRGTQHLARAAKLRGALLPVTGALVGLTVGGPVGLVLGTKMALLGCTLGAGILGYTGGKALQRRKEGPTKVPVMEDMELREMPKNQSPDNTELQSPSSSRRIV
ncbi:syntaxin 17 isoform X2 [Haemaphysalis longicornis]